MYTLTLSDGTTLRNLEANGDVLYTSETVTADTFTGKLDTVTISNGSDDTRTLTECVLLDIGEADNNKTYFVIVEKTAEMRMRDQISELESVNTELELALTEVYELIIGG